MYNNQKFISKNGLYDLLEQDIDSEILYPIIHLKGDDIEVALTHCKNQYSEQYYSFVNGQHTVQGGTHQGSFREAIAKTIREFYGKNYDTIDIRQAVYAAISIKIIEPVFESQTKTKLGSNEMEPRGVTIRTFVNDFIKTQLDNYLHKHPETAIILQKKIIPSGMRERIPSPIPALYHFHLRFHYLSTSAGVCQPIYPTIRGNQKR